MIERFSIKWSKFAGDHPWIYWGGCSVVFIFILYLL